MLVGCVAGESGSTGDPAGAGGSGRAGAGENGSAGGAPGGSGGTSSVGGGGASGSAGAGLGGSSGAVGGSGGAGAGSGQGGAGASGESDGGMVDATQGGQAGDGDAGDASPSQPVPPPPITECSGPSLDRLQKWLAHALVGNAAPGSSLLVADGGGYVARWKTSGGGGNWSEVVVLIGNEPNAGVDLGKNDGFVATYSATADIWIQLRGTVHLHTGDQYAFRLPSTAGQRVSMNVPFAASAWKSVFGPPPVPFADVLRTANKFDIISNAPSDVTFFGLRFEKYLPDCR